MLYEVKAIKNRRIKTVKGYVLAEEGYVVHRSYQAAGSPGEAVRMVRDYHLTPGTKFDCIEVHAA